MKAPIRKILMLAGEESGVLYAEELKKRLPGCDIRGYGDYGFQTHDMAVMGILPVLLKVFFFLRLLRTMRRAIEEWRPDLVLTIDYPGMNLKLAAFARAHGVRTVHVVCPQVWAWKKSRIPKIEASLDHLCCFLPFEPKLFRPGFATFVGHPLASSCGPSRPRDAGGDRIKTVALLPGSRKGEISKILPTLLEAAAELRKDSGDKVRFVIPAATPRAYAQIEKILRRFSHFNFNSSLSLRLGGARELLKAADCAAVASGTATLEAAFARCPTVLVYRMTATFAWVIRHFVKGTRFAGLANVIWERCRPGPGFYDDTERVNLEIRDPEQPMPELIQENLTPEAVRRYLKGFLEDGRLRSEAVRRMDAALSPLDNGGDPFANIISIVNHETSTTNN